MASRAWRSAALAVSLAGALAALLLDRLAPYPSADVARGSEEAFASGLELREFTPGPLRRPQRWTGARVEVGFLNLPQGPRTLEIALHQHRQPIVVAVDGAIVGSLPPRVNAAEFVLPSSKHSFVSVELRTETFAAGGGRQLGAYFDRVALRHARGGLPAYGLLALGASVPLGVLVAAGLSGASPLAAAGLALLSLVAYAGLLWPMGLLRSGYGARLALLILCGAMLACAFARWRRTPWGFVALFCAWLVQGVAMTSPMAVMSDAVMHFNKLKDVAACASGSQPLERCAQPGNGFFPLTETQHARPFPLPYPIVFYLLLSPLLWAGVDGVSLVRYAAGMAGALSAGAVFLIGEAVPRRAALAVLLLQALPITCDVYAYGNLSNIFGQAATLAFLAWWLVPRGGSSTGALLLLTAALAHFSSLIVLAVLVPLLLLLERPLAKSGRTRLTVVLIAAVLASLYYSRYLPLMLELLPRLLEGGSSGPRSLGLTDAFMSQLGNAVRQWGWPVVFLAALGLPRPSRSQPDRLLTAVWGMGATLLIAAAVSPLEVRYLYAMGFAVTLAASDGAFRLFERGRTASAAAAVLLAWQAVLAFQGIREIVVSRYRL